MCVGGECACVSGNGCVAQSGDHLCLCNMDEALGMLHVRSSVKELLIICVSVTRTWPCACFIVRSSVN